MLVTLFITLSFASAIAFSVLSVWAWRTAPSAVGRSYVAFCLTAAIWSFFYAFELLLPEISQKLWAIRLQYIGIVSLPVAWLYFSSGSAGRWRQIDRRYLLATSLLPLLTLLAVWTTPAHPLIYAQPLTIIEVAGAVVLDLNYGPWFLVHTLYSYGLIALGSIWLLSAALQSVRDDQLMLIFVAVAVPLASNLLTLIDNTPLSHFDFAPLTLPISGVIFAYLLRSSSGGPTLAIRYTDVIDGLSDAVIVIDAQDRIVTTNAALKTLLREQPPKLTVGQPLVEALPEVRAILDKIRAGGLLQQSVRLGARYIDLSVVDLQQGAGRMIVLHDKTTRHQIETALYAYERRYRSLFENSNDAILILDWDMTILIANARAAEVLGTEQDLLLQESARPLFDDVEFARFEETIEALRHQLSVPLYETTFFREDGTTVPVEISVTLVRDTDGTPLHIQMIARDISERIEAQHQISTRLEQLNGLREVDEEVNRSLDLDHVRKIALAAAMRLSAADAGFIALAQLDSDVVYVSEVAGAYTAAWLGRTVEYGVGITGQVMQDYESRLVTDVHAHPTYLPEIPETVAAISLPLMSQDRFVGILHLETAQHNHFDRSIFEYMRLVAGRLAVAVDNARLYAYVRSQLSEVRQLYEELRSAERLKTDMIRIANHDLKNPLNTVRGYVELMALEEDEMNADHAEFIPWMRDSLDRMDSILKDFLTLEAINERARGATMSRLHLHRVVKRALREYQGRAAEKSLQIVEELHDEALCYVKGDEAQLYEAITNLISNAIKYTPPQGEVRVELGLSADFNVQFVVHDSGYGIPEDRQKRLFEPFYRSRTVETATIEGTGLGLHLVKNIVERHAGTMIFRSVYQQGSTFGFILPIAQS